MKAIKRVFSVILCLAMIMGCFTVGVSAEETTVSATLVTDVEKIMQGGSYVLVVENDGNYYAMKNAVESDRIYGTAIDAPEDSRIQEIDLPVWTVAAEGDGISLHNGTVYVKHYGADKTELKAADEAFKFTLTRRDDGSMTVGSSIDKERALAYYKTSGYVRAYKTTNDTGGLTYSFGIYFYKVDAEGSDTTACDHAAAEAESYQTDLTDHWKVCPSCQEEVNKAAHDTAGTDGACSICGHVGLSGYYQKVDLSSTAITEGYYVIGGVANSAIDDGTRYAYVSGELDGADRLYGAYLTPNCTTVTTTNTNLVWKFIAADGGFYIQNASTEQYLYTSSTTGKIFVTGDVTGASVWKVVAVDDIWALQETSNNYYLSATRYGSSGSYYLGFAAYTSARAIDLYAPADAAGEHNYVDSICTKCGGQELPEIASTNVRFGNALSLIIAYNTADLGSTENLKAVVTNTIDNSTVNLTNWSTATNSTTGATYYTVELTGISAKQIADTYTIVIQDSNGNAVTKTETVSIRDYALKILANENKTKAYKQVVMDMLNYGAAAQTQYTHNTENPANTGCDAYKEYASDSMADVTDNRTVTVDGTTTTGDEVKLDGVFGGSNLRFNDEINILFRFKIDLGTYAVVTWKDYKGVEHTVTVTSDQYTGDGDYYVVELTELVVADARRDVTCTIYTADRSNPVISVTDSVASNVARVSDTYKDLYQAFMKYADATKDYLTTQTNEEV